MNKQKLFNDVFRLFLTKLFETKNNYPSEKTPIINEPFPVSKTTELFFDGIPLTELTQLAKRCYHGVKCTIDQYGNLVFHYTSNSRKTTFQTQMWIEESTGKLACSSIHYPNQWKSSADRFVQLFNDTYKN